MYTDNLKTKRAKRGAKACEYVGWRPDIEIVFLVGVIVATLLLVSPAMAQDGEARIRMAHLSPDAPAVMVELDGEPVEDLAHVSYKDSSPYLPIPAGPHEVAVYAAADPSEPVLEVSISPEAGSSYTVAGVGLIGDGTFGARLFEDDTSEPGEGKARVRVIHAIPDVGAATVGVEDGPDLFTLPGFANASDYLGVEAGTYTLDVTPAGAPEPAFNVPDVRLKEGEIYTAFAFGQASEGTVGAMLTVDSDNGRVVGPRTLEDTSGDLSLLEKEDPYPQPQSASSTIAQRESDEATPPKDSEEKPEPDNPAPDKKSKPAAPAESEGAAREQKAKPESEKPAENEGEASGGAESGGAESEGAERKPTEDGDAESASAPVESPPAPAVETYQDPYQSASAPVETYQAPVETYQAPAPVVAYQAPAAAYQAPVHTQTYTPPPVENVESAVVAPTVEEVVVETIGDAAFVPQPAPAAPAVVPPVPVAEVLPMPTVDIPPVPTVEISSVPAVSASSRSSQATDSAQSVAVGVAATSGFAPAAPLVPAVQSVAAQSTSPQGVPDPGAGFQAPVGEVVGMVVNTPAVVNSGARRKFVTIRRRSLPRSPA